MKKISSFIFSILLLSFFHYTVYAQTSSAYEGETNDIYKPSINIFKLHGSEEYDSDLISLSDIYNLESNASFDDQEINLIIPNMTEDGFTEAQYTLTGGYRKKFLSHTGISETDFVFIYDYENNRLTTLAVKDLNVIARLNLYSDLSEAPFPHYYYMIGFEVDSKVLDDIFGATFVYVGAKNPFALEQLTPLVWKKVNLQDLPETTPEQDQKFYASYPWNVNFSSEGGNTHLSEANGLQYFLQDYVRGESVDIDARRLLVFDPQTKEIIIDKIFYESESTSLAPLKGGEGNYNNTFEESFQWAGKLFKDKPPVTFGFLWVSFGCPAISVIDSSSEDIEIYCDNRH